VYLGELASICNGALNKVSKFPEFLEAQSLDFPHSLNLKSTHTHDFEFRERVSCLSEICCRDFKFRECAW